VQKIGPRRLAGYRIPRDRMLQRDVEIRAVDFTALTGTPDGGECVINVSAGRVDMAPIIGDTGGELQQPARDNVSRLLPGRFDPRHCMEFAGFRARHRVE